MKKRGQVTIFIILGIILLIAISLVIIFREEVTIFKPKRVIPTEASSLVVYADNCLESVSHNALNLLGAQGGYIYLPTEIENNPLAYINTGLKIPHWQYIDQNRIPSLPLMEAHLSQYIEENINKCLLDFEPFQKEFNIVPTGSLDVKTTIGNRNVFFQINYPLELQNKQGTKITEVSEFQSTSPIQLKKVYEVAKKIMETEAAESKIEKLTVDLISLDPEIPISGFDATCAQKIWQVDKVENKLKTLLRTNLPSVRVDKTSYLPIPEDQPYIQNHYLWQVTDIKYPDIKSSIQFNENNPFSLQVTPRDGNLLKSGQQKGRDIAAFLCMQMWKFTYSVKYPVVVSVEDITNNFILNFAFDVQVKKNRASRDTLGQAQQQFIQYDATQESYCDPANYYGNYIMKINTYDNISEPGFPESHEPIRDVNITFTCLKYTCDLGQSKFQSAGVLASLETQFPYCVNGIVRGKKQGYQMAQEFVTTAPGKEVNLYLTPLKVFNKFTVVKQSGQTISPLAQGETAFITINYIQNNTIQHTSSSTYPGYSGGELFPLEFLAGGDFTYQLEIFLMDQETVIGGYQGTWTPSWSNLKYGTEIEFHVIDIGAPNTEQQTLNFFNTLNTYSSNPVIK